MVFMNVPQHLSNATQWLFMIPHNPEAGISRIRQNETSPNWLIRFQPTRILPNCWNLEGLVPKEGLVSPEDTWRYLREYVPRNRHPRGPYENHRHSARIEDINLGAGDIAIYWLSTQRRMLYDGASVQLVSYGVVVSIYLGENQRGYFCVTVFEGNMTIIMSVWCNHGTWYFSCVKHVAIFMYRANRNRIAHWRRDSAIHSWWKW